jgi:DNA-binding CsgD family transcriptional regulator
MRPFPSRQICPVIFLDDCIRKAGFVGEWIYKGISHLRQVRRYMYVKPISALVEFFSHGFRSADDLCRFLIFETFQMFSTKCIFVGEIDSSGYLIHKASFGFEPEELNNWLKLSLSLDVPITRAARSNKCIVVKSPEEFYGNYPVATDLGAVDAEWQSCIAVPVLPHGVYFLINNAKMKKDSEFEPFLRAVGLIMMMYLNRGESHKKSVDSTSRSSEMTQRQKIILSLLEKGFTNSQIALEIGYSESLVRHETIEIYSKLHVSGRKEILEKLGGGGGG